MFPVARFLCFTTSLHTFPAAEYYMIKNRYHTELEVERGGKENKLTKRDIFFLVSVAFLGIFILTAAYLWRENYVYSRELAASTGNYAKQTEELLREEKNAGVTSKQDNSQPGSTANPSAAVNQPSAANPGNIQNQPANPAQPTAVKNSSSFTAPDTKVGDIVKLGEVEMIVTKSTAKHKVIDITFKGNTREQPPKLVLTENNRIVYEIPADVDVNVDITEKTVIDKSPLFYNDQKAGQ